MREFWLFPEAPSIRDLRYGVYTDFDFGLGAHLLVSISDTHIKLVREPFVQCARARAQNILGRRDLLGHFVFSLSFSVARSTRSQYNWCLELLFASTRFQAFWDDKRVPKRPFTYRWNSNEGTRRLH